MRQRVFELWVGIFMLLGISALLFLALRVSGLTTQTYAQKGYEVKAHFANIGGLKVRSAVSIAGVVIGRVDSIRLESDGYNAVVTMSIDANQANIPDDSTASILTQGLLGSNYVGLTPGYSSDFLTQGSVLDNTQSAIILENLISQFMFSVNKS
jgi:phospholipid/cholesterol/gamma-HCH transport system substrate-binding protein